MVEIVRHWALSNACFAPIFPARLICKLWLLGMRPQCVIASHSFGRRYREGHETGDCMRLHERNAGGTSEDGPGSM
jgi:hypothetical protein